ncbi:unnamed protein product [Zymoseptoria tritici ST99CH_3D7]|uniref:UNC-45/Cro1/She4 central domain-containing protein n=1 Tax=Zymoseptoria tritici (strain ST99CH_3D7) TaxID=1276538 RepID=A0A1X7RLQ6_ZYMT9|nr:unnamed protein product [Zymoseptoria tritici ST99CH_3D7]
MSASDQADVQVDQAVVQRALSQLSAISAYNDYDSTDLAILVIDSRQSSATRQRLATPETLKGLVHTVEVHLNTNRETSVLALRCIANACADNTPARDIITASGFSWAAQCLAVADFQLSVLTSKVLFNICSDHEPSQKKCFEERLHVPLINFLASKDAVRRPNGADEKETHAADITFAIDVLFMVAGMKASAGTQSDELLSANDLVNLIFLPDLHSRYVDVETFASLSETVLAFLRDPKEQEHIIAKGHVGYLLDILRRQQFKASKLDPSDEEAAENLKVLLALSTSFVWILSDIAALPAFKTIYSLERVECEGLFIRFIQSDDARERRNDPNGLLLTANFQALGNLLWALPAEQFGHLVERDELALHRPAMAAILAAGNSKEDAMAVHSAAGLLIQLSRPSVRVREFIGGAGSSLSVLERLIRHELPGVKQEGVKLLRALGKDCPTNQQKFAELAKEVMLASAESNNAAIVEEVPS